MDIETHISSTALFTGFQLCGVIFQFCQSHNPQLIAIVFLPKIIIFDRKLSCRRITSTKQLYGC